MANRGKSGVLDALHPSPRPMTQPRSNQASLHRTDENNGKLECINEEQKGEELGVILMTQEAENLILVPNEH